jgi:hypothetical protein
VRPRTAAVAGIAVLALGAAGCGKTTHPSSAENDGVYVDAGPLTYQLELSRELNPYSTEDSQYVKGVPSTDASLDANHVWYGVFLWAKNQTRQRQVTAGNFDIVDTEGNHYSPIALNTAVNPYAWTSEELTPNAIEPKPDTTASFGPTQGGLLLFKLPNAVYDNRPLQLEIRSPSGQVWGSISLDL